jgi:hypothetical protein
LEFVRLVSSCSSFHRWTLSHLTRRLSHDVYTILSLLRLPAIFDLIYLLKFFFDLIYLLKFLYNLVKSNFNIFFWMETQLDFLTEIQSWQK